MEYSDKSSTGSSAEDAVVDYYDDPVLAPQYVPTVVPSDFPAVTPLDVPSCPNAAVSNSVITEVAEIEQLNNSPDASTQEDTSGAENIEVKDANNQQGERIAEPSDCAVNTCCMSDSCEDQKSKDKTKKKCSCGLCCCGCMYSSYLVYKAVMNWSPPCCGLCCIAPALKLVWNLSTCCCCCCCCKLFDDEDIE